MNNIETQRTRAVRLASTRTALVRAFKRASQVLQLVYGTGNPVVMTVLGLSLVLYYVTVLVEIGPLALRHDLVLVSGTLGGLVLAAASAFPTGEAIRPRLTRIAASLILSCVLLFVADVCANLSIALGGVDWSTPEWSMAGVVRVAAIVGFVAFLGPALFAFANGTLELLSALLDLSRG